MCASSCHSHVLRACTHALCHAHPAAAASINHVHEGLVAHARRYSSKCWRVGPDTENGEQCGAVLNPREEGDCYNREHVWPVRRLSSPTGTSNCSWRASPVSVFAVPRGGLNFELSLSIVSIVLKLNADSQVGLIGLRPCGWDMFLEETH